MLWSLVYQFDRVMSHLVPRGTPRLLMPVIVLIERIRNLIRPGTLAVRLAANMVAGHLLLTLIGSSGPSLDGVVRILLITIMIICLLLFLILELGVSLIQAYVFTVLRRLFLREVSGAKFNITNMLKRVSQLKKVSQLVALM